MKQFVAIICFALCWSVNASAQSYLEHLQKKTQGLGSVSVTESKEIDELVNGQPTKHPTETTPPATTNHKETHQPHPAGTEHHTAETEHHTAIAEHPAANENKETERRREAKKPERTSSGEEENANIPTVDMRKKVMRGSYKVTGYRVQAFAGGNSRKDRQKAESIGNAIKMKYPDQPVYVHFYSPRWICRVGNFRSQAEARKMLNNIRRMGYKSACLVKGKITVQR